MIEFEERRHFRILPEFAAGAKVVARSTAVRDHRREAEGDELWPHQGPAGACAAPFATKALENLSFRCNAIAAIARSKAAAPLSRRFGVPSAQFRIVKGEPRSYVARSDAGNEIARVFCGDCGTPLYVQVSTRPDLVGIRVASFDDPSWFRPDADIFVKSAQPWDYMNPDVPKYSTYPPGKSY